MRFNNKNYKLKKIKFFFEKNSLFFICTSNNLNSKNDLKLKQILRKHNLTRLVIKTSLAKIFIKNSIFKNFLGSITGTLCLVKINSVSDSYKTLKTVISLNNYLTFIGLKINQKIYSQSQLENLQLLNYPKNIINFTKTLNKLVKTPYYKLKNTNSK